MFRLRGRDGSWRQFETVRRRCRRVPGTLRGAGPASAQRPGRAGAAPARRRRPAQRRARARAAGLHRLPDRPAQPRPADGRAGRGPRPRRRRAARRRACCCSTSTASSRSTTSPATRRATTCWSRSPRGCGPRSGTATWSAGSVATSSPSWSPTALDEATALAERIVAELPDGAPRARQRGRRRRRRLRRLRQRRRHRAATRPTTCRPPSARPTSRCARPRRPARAASGRPGTPSTARPAGAPGWPATCPTALEQEQFRVVYQPVVGRGRAADPGPGGAGPLGPPGARHRAAGRVHLPGRGRRPDRDRCSAGCCSAPPPTPPRCWPPGGRCRWAVNVSVRHLQAGCLAPDVAPRWPRPGCRRAS